MKKIFLLAIYIILYNPNVFAQLTKQQAWAIALTGMLTEQNWDNYSTLGFNDINQRNKQRYNNLLVNDWNIHNREELLITIGQLEKNGHAEYLKNIKQIVESEEDCSIVTINNKYHLNAREYNYLKFIAANWNIYKNRDIMAWDLGRIIALCRWGYVCEYLDEEEAWEKVMYYAKKIQPLYTSWEEYGTDYLFGRIFWAAGSGDDVSILPRTEQIYRYLISKTGYWRNFNWDIDLNGYDQYDINTINWVEDKDEFIQYKTNDSLNCIKVIKAPESIDISKYEIIIKKIKGRRASFGIYFNYIDTRNYYRLLISTSSGYGFQKMVNGRITTINDFAYNSAIKRGYETENVIRVDYYENKYEIYINNTKVNEIEDANGQDGNAYCCILMSSSETEQFPIESEDVRYKIREKKNAT
ncbi:MAG: DUF1266 domain-containing protein, partial [Spirochaetaceae bacterium]|nr:DUF1266 domain-containing protein [Spirochaetaceae bacterium]